MTFVRVTSFPGDFRPVEVNGRRRNSGIVIQTEPSE
jgi:hypothetical protein